MHVNHLCVQMKFFPLLYLSFILVYLCWYLSVISGVLLKFSGTKMKLLRSTYCHLLLDASVIRF